MGSGPSDYWTEVSAAQVLKQLSEYTSMVVRQEIRRAQLEGNIPPQHPRSPSGPFGRGGLLALLGVSSLMLAGVIALSQLLAVWITVTLVGLLLLAIGSGLLVGSRLRLARILRNEPEPEYEPVVGLWMGGSPH
jgi:Putative Actinobacterial Holin-X, holin superfamily III